MSVPGRVAAFLVPAALSFIAAPPAFAGVYGGTTSDDAAIVVESDAKAKKLRRAVIAWSAACGDGRQIPWTSDLSPATAEPGFMPGPDDLAMSRNAKGRFSGKQITSGGNGSTSAIVEVTLSGKLRTTSASGKLRAHIVIIDDAAGTEVTTCDTGSLSWSASRSPGRIYAGSTSQDHPVVARVDRKRGRVTDLLVGWESASCQPDGYYWVPEHFTGLRLQGSSFTDAFDQSYTLDDGGSIAFAYALGGKVSKRTIRGDLQVTVTGTDAAGAPNLACDSGKLSWRAATG